MPDDDFKAMLRPVASQLNKLLKDRGQQFSLCGGKRDSLPDLDRETGIWVDPGQTNKAPRWIVHFERDGNGWKAKIPDIAGARRLAAYNTASGKVGGIGVLPLPAVKRNDVYTFIRGWSWLLWFIFPEPLKQGSSAQLVEGFNPAEGKLTYLNEETPYVASGLVKLLGGEETDPGPPALTYQEATNALSRLIHVNNQRVANKNA